MSGFKPLWMPDFLYDFQASLDDWIIRMGRGALFADTGLGKGPMALVWGENVVRHTNRRVLLLTPLAVGAQILREAERFGVAAKRSRDGTAHRGITIANYESLEKFDPDDFAGCVCDESSILKNFDGARKAQITEFLRRLPYRLLCTATAAPNDYIELGTSSEALGQLGAVDMLNRFFKNDQNNSSMKGSHRLQGGGPMKWRFRGHARVPFWRWVCSWARALRRPSDLGFSDDRFILPPLIEREHIVEARTLPPGMLFPVVAQGLAEEREEARRTMIERCERAAELVHHDQQALIWCNLNPEGDLLANLIPGAVQVSGADPLEEKEEKLTAFAEGKARVLITKPKIGAWGLNLQNCAHQVHFPTHSYEARYQGIRRSWRYGQTRPVVIDTVTTESGRGIMANLQRKGRAADEMFDELTRYMRDALTVRPGTEYNLNPEVPEWLCSTNA
jgi:hypothetical protein